MAAAVTVDHGIRGQRWGEGIARCFSVEDDLDEELAVRLQPIPDSFKCSISLEVMEDPVATLDGSVYDRRYIEDWWRRCQENHRPLTSPNTGLTVARHLISLEALRKAIETYMSLRPELKSDRGAKRSLEEAACLLQNDLDEKQAINQSIEERAYLLQNDLEEKQAEIKRLQRMLAASNAECEEADSAPRPETLAEWQDVPGGKAAPRTPILSREAVASNPARQRSRSPRDNIYGLVSRTSGKGSGSCKTFWC